jgi:dTDP-4-dehydrorhamnose reductase
MKRVLVLGGGGVLAREVAPALDRAGWAVQCLPRAACDITDAAATAAAVAAASPDLIVNSAAYTDVDRAEQDRERAFAVNARGAGNVARAARAKGARLLHISTDYVFDGSKRARYVETDPPSPLGIYARSKRAGEEEVVATCEDAWIVRTGALYGAGGRNFFHAILARARAGQPLSVVDDQIVTPTWARELARQLVRLASADAPPGIYHATAAGETSWFEAARVALRAAHLEVAIEAISTERWGSPTPRPRYSVLASARLEQLGLYEMRPWHHALMEWIGGT